MSERKPAGSAWADYLYEVIMVVVIIMCSLLVVGCR